MECCACEKKNVDKETDMQHINRMNIDRKLRELITKEGKLVRKTSADLQIDRASLQRSIKEGANPGGKTIQKILNYLGYEIRIVKSKRKHA